MESMDLPLNNQNSDTDGLSLENSEHLGTKAQFKLDAFSGPLDLLLFLVKQHKIDIYDIPITKITNQYLEYLNQMLVYDLNDLTEFYKTATWLLHIKSRTLLPVHTDFDDEEIDTSRAELINTLIEYQKYKKLSDMLSERHDKFSWVSLRQTGALLPIDIEKDDEWTNVTSMELCAIFIKLMDRPSESQRIIDLNEQVSVNQKITLIYEKLDEHGECFFDEIVSGGGVLSIVCTLLALLELMKNQYARALQHVLNGEIKIIKVAQE